MSKLSEINDWPQENLQGWRTGTRCRAPPWPSPRVKMVEAVAGVLNKNTGVETTTDSLFQIGSITNVWTTTLAMQLVDEGLLDVDPDRPEISGGRACGLTLARHSGVPIISAA